MRGVFFCFPVRCNCFWKLCLCLQFVSLVRLLDQQGLSGRGVGEVQLHHRLGGVHGAADAFAALCGCGGGVGAKTGLYLTPVSDPGVVHPVYEVRDGKILFHDEWHPINLPDGYYVIRKLTVDECKRLQTVPDWYDMTCISASQSYKCIGNGWTVEVIMYLIASAMGI